MQWLVTQHSASLRWGDWTWQYQLDKPSSGIDVCGPNQFAANLLSTQAQPKHDSQVEDSFARGSDLMVRYGQSTNDQFAYQIDLRAVPKDQLHGFDCGVDLWLSIQTQLLDAHPTLRLVLGRLASTSVDGDATTWRSVPDATYQASSALSQAVVMVHPSDQRQSTFVDTPASQYLQLFGAFMEKGVIRRARFRCLLAAQKSRCDLTSAQTEFAHSPLPLTA